MPLQDRSGKQKNPGGDESRPSDKCLKSIKDWLCRIGTVEVLTAVLAFAALVQLWGYINGERAFVYAENVTLLRGLINVDPLPMRLEIRNAGKSVATIKEVVAAITQGPLAEVPRYAEAPKFAFPPAVSGGVVKRPLSFDLNGGYKEAKVSLLRSGKERFYLYGVIRYGDGYNFPSIFGYKETGFCFLYVYDGGEDGFETCQEPAYTYAN